MKGPVVAALFYPDVGDRTYGDLDLLVGRRDFSEAMRILEELGYQHTIRRSSSHLAQGHRTFHRR
jgi:hypothetical protein